MTIVRHGMMLVGPTGGGKSRVMRALQAAMSRVKDDPEFKLVRVYQMNPKSITMNQLYGAFDLQASTPPCLHPSPRTREEDEPVDRETDRRKKKPFA